MRTSLTIAGLALVAAGLPVAAAAEPAVAETCQGKPVTVLDSDGGYVEGTEGDDVILVSGGGDSTIDALGGDDTICFENGVVRAGPGRDAVQLRPVWADAAIIDAEDLDISGRPDGPLYLRLQNVGRQGGGQVTLDEDDSLELVGKDIVVVNLKADLMSLDGSSYSLVGQPPVDAVARRVLLVGDAARNRLHVHQRTCKARIEGGRGRDSLQVVSTFLGFEPFPLPTGCGRRKSEVHGQRGNDRLQGGRFDDVLVGGPGRDRAQGLQGVDTCVAETEKSCER